MTPEELLQKIEAEGCNLSITDGGTLMCKPPPSVSLQIEFAGKAGQGLRKIILDRDKASAASEPQ